MSWIILGKLLLHALTVNVSGSQFSRMTGFKFSSEFFLGGRLYYTTVSCYSKSFVATN